MKHKSLFTGMLIILVGLSALLLAGCGSEISNENSNGKSTYSDYKMPENFETQVFYVEDSDGYPVERTEIAQCEQANLSKIWEDWKAKKEGEDKYDMIKKVYHEDNSDEDEEEELKYYCESLFSNSCLEMEYIKDHNGCREVDIECDKYNGDDICIRYDVDISDEILDDDEC